MAQFCAFRPSYPSAETAPKVDILLDSRPQSLKANSGARFGSCLGSGDAQLSTSEQLLSGIEPNACETAPERAVALYFALSSSALSLQRTCQMTSADFPNHACSRLYRRFLNDQPELRSTGLTPVNADRPLMGEDDLPREA